MNQYTFSIYRCAFCYSEKPENLDFIERNGTKMVMCITCKHYSKKTFPKESDQERNAQDSREFQDEQVYFDD